MLSIESGVRASFRMESQEQTFRATEIWQELVLSFRLSMPRCKHRLKMRWYEDSFTGREAVEWLHSYLRLCNKFGSSVSKEQALKLLEKFLSSDVICEVRGKNVAFEEDSTFLYKFVTEPGPFNFIEEEAELSRPLSPAGKRERSNSCCMDTEPPSFGGACFTNEHASESDESMIIGTPLKKSRSEGSLARHLTLRDVNVQNSAEKLSPAQIAATWKEVTLFRLLRLVELPGLDGVLDHDAVDGKLIRSNVLSGGRGLFTKAAAKLRQSVVRQDKKPPLPPNPHTTLTTTHHHHKRRFSTKISSESTQSSTHTESVADVPQWVVLAMKCLEKWPDGCTEELVGDNPVYSGFEQDVLQSLIQYFQSLSEPLISTKLYDLLMAVHNLVAAKKIGATDALQLCTLLLPQSNRTRLHRMLRFLYKTSSNTQLILSRGELTRDVLLRNFAGTIVRSRSKLSRVEVSERRNIEGLVTFMAQNYQHIFKVPEDLKKEVQKRLDAISSGKGDVIPGVGGACCSRLSSQEYEKEGVSASQSALLGLLDTILSDQAMRDKEKRQRLKDFQRAYPDLYTQRVPLETAALLEVKGDIKKKIKRHASLSLRKRPRPILSERSDSSETLNTVVLR